MRVDDRARTADGDGVAVTTLGELAALCVCLRLRPDALDRHGAWESLSEAARRAVGVGIARPNRSNKFSNNSKRDR